MRTVKEVSDLTGVSIRALHYYDKIGLLRPTHITESGYRLYDDKAMIDLARGIQMIGVKSLLDFNAFDTGKIDEYAKQARDSWGQTQAWHEFVDKAIKVYCGRMQ